MTVAHALDSRPRRRYRVAGALSLLSSAALGLGALALGLVGSIATCFGPLSSAPHPHSGAELIFVSFAISLSGIAALIAGLLLLSRSATHAPAIGPRKVRAAARG